MLAGKLRSRVIIQVRSTGADDAGQPVTTWQDYTTVWADIRLLSGLETIRADQGASITKASIRIRYTAALAAGITPAMRVVEGTTVYQITAVLPDVARHVYIDLPCEQVYGSV